MSSSSSPWLGPAQPLGNCLSLIGTILTMPLLPEGSLGEERQEEKKGLSGGMLWPREILGVLLKEPLGRECPWTARSRRVLPRGDG